MSTPARCLEIIIVRKKEELINEKLFLFMTILFFYSWEIKDSFKSSGDLEEKIPSLTLSSFILKSGDIFYCQKSHEKNKTNYIGYK